MKFTKELDDFKDLSIKKINQLSIPKTSSNSIKGRAYQRCAHSFHVDFAYRLGPPNTNRRHRGYNSPYHPVQKTSKEDNIIEIAVLRNPFDMLCSYYFHGDKLKPGAEYCHSGWASVNYIHQFHSFEEFIKGYCDEEFEWHQPLFKQFLFSQLFNEDGKCVPDILLKYEYLDESVPIMNKTWGLNLSRARAVNVSKRKKHKYEFYYNDELIKLVNKKCYKELEMFKYDFENTLDDSYFIIPENLNFKLQKGGDD